MIWQANDTIVTNSSALTLGCLCLWSLYLRREDDFNWTMAALPLGKVDDQVNEDEFHFEPQRRHSTVATLAKIRPPNGLVALVQIQVSHAEDLWKKHPQAMGIVCPHPVSCHFMQSDTLLYPLAGKSHST